MDIPIVMVLSQIPYYVIILLAIREIRKVRKFKLLEEIDI